MSEEKWIGIQYLENNAFYVTHDVKNRDDYKHSFETLGINNVLALGKIMYDRYSEVTQQIHFSVKTFKTNLCNR